jgi:hypothetical protein
MHAKSKRGLVIGLFAVAVIGGGIAAIIVGTGDSPKSATTETKPPEVKAETKPTETKPPEVKAPVAKPEPATITLRFAIEPASAEVEIDGVRANADQVVEPKDGEMHKVHITAAGYLPHDENVRFDETQRLTIELQKAGAKPTKPQIHPTTKNRPDKIESQSPYD